MPVIELSTVIRAPRKLVFDLARSIDAPQDSTEGTGERAVAGVTKGLIGMDGGNVNRLSLCFTEASINAQDYNL